MTHLGERVSALLDGQLSPEAAERATAHLAGCRDCRDAVEIERLTKARLACLSGPEPGGDLVGRLLAMGGPSGPLPPRPGHVPGTPRPAPVPLTGPLPPRVPVSALLASGFRVASSHGSVRPPDRRPASGPGRGGARQAHRARLAGAVLGALGVVGAGVGGLILTAPASGLAGGTAGFGTAGAVASLSVQQPASPAAVLPRGPRFVPAVAPRLPVLYRDGH